jgi:sarcosine oxidase / L-pipecolate oxidase
MATQQHILIVGAGIFGVAAAHELATRGHRVTLMDPGPIPAEHAASTDISKIVRMDYGTDDFYTDMMREAFTGWDRWNAAWETPLYHETGFLLMKSAEMTPGSFEWESYTRLEPRGVTPERLDSASLAKDHPLWNAERYVDGYRSPRAGWAQSGEVVAKVASLLPALDVDLRDGTAFERFIEDGSKVVGIVTADRTEIRADLVVMATGAWTASYLPHLSDRMWPSGQSVVFFKPDKLERFTPPSFMPWAGDISETGWYGFPLSKTGVVKIGNHSTGIVPIDPHATPHIIPDNHIEHLREFLAVTIPALADAPVVGTRVCMYCDTWDGHFWIDHDPDRPGLMVAAGGSGHGFKFAPLIGHVIADVAERKPNRYAERFAWRTRGEKQKEAARAT